MRLIMSRKIFVIVKFSGEPSIFESRRSGSWIRWFITCRNHIEDQKHDKELHQSSNYQGDHDGHEYTRRLDFSMPDDERMCNILYKGLEN